MRPSTGAATRRPRPRAGRPATSPAGGPAPLLALSFFDLFAETVAAMTLEGSTPVTATRNSRSMACEVGPWDDAFVQAG